MKVVEVRHNKKSDKTYWFNLPESLKSHYLYSGRNVLCKTRRGLAPGEVVSVANEAPVPVTSEIVSVEASVPLRNILITPDMQMSHPNPYKILSVIQYYYDYNDFDQRPVLRQIGESSYFTLEDGYIRYLVAKMFGLNTMKCFVVGDKS